MTAIDLLTPFRARIVRELARVHPGGLTLPGIRGIPGSEKHADKKLGEILDALVADEFAACVPSVDRFGRAVITWRATEAARLLAHYRPVMVTATAAKGVRS